MGCFCRRASIVPLSSSIQVHGLLTPGEVEATMYGFHEQLSAGEQQEQELDKFFVRWYDIQRAALDQQRCGIDRIFTRRDNGYVFKIEYKADWTASKTGNAFVETVSVDTTHTPGWVYSSQADYLIYYLPKDMRAYILAFEQLRARLPQWEKFPIRSIPNKGYSTVGVLVPLGEFERIAIRVVSVDNSGSTPDHE
jgi:hypothetical protein